MKKVSFGIVNCNRLFYLQSCLESLLETTSDWDNKEIIVVDNASVEPGTQEYLADLENRGIKVIRKNERNFSNEFAMGLNTIISNSTGDYLCMLQGDMQFVLPGWLNDVISFYEMNLDVVGSIMLDAQRRVTHDSHKILPFPSERQPMFCKNNFFADVTRDPIAPAADALFSRQVIEQIAPWCEDNVNHEGSMDSENEMRYRILGLMKQGKMPRYITAFASIPQAIAIYTDPRGTQGRVRGNKRYGDYWKAKDETGWKYYDFISEDQFDRNKVNSIEDVAKPVGFSRTVGPDGNWLKNPIRPESASSTDWVDL